MALARGGGANELVAAGAIMSGIYFGDRCSPASSCANLVASLTGTELYDNIRLMMKTSLAAVGCCGLFYYLLSLTYPMPRADSGMILSLEKSFDLTPWVIVPAIIMFVMPLLKVRSLYAFLACVPSCLFPGPIREFSTARICSTAFRDALPALCAERVPLPL